MPLRFIDHGYRPAMSYMKDSDCDVGQRPLLTQNSPLHVRTQNVGFVTSGLSSINDLRHPITRARELAEGIVNDASQPDVIVFQEAFHEDASWALCQGLQKKYPYIIHSVAPHVSGFNSGMMVASKHPIDSASFHKFEDMIPDIEKACAPKGVLKVSLKFGEKTVMLYGAHTQSMLSEGKSAARLKQFKAVAKMMREDFEENTGVLQIFAGD